MLHCSPARHVRLLLEPPSAQSPFARARCYLTRHGVAHHVRGHYPTFIALTGSCASPSPSSCLGHTLNTRSMQVAVSPCWEKDLPDVISAYLSLRAWTPTPAAREVHIPVTSLTTAAFPSFGPGRRSTMYRTATSVRRAFSRLQSFADVQARRFARHPDRSYRYGFHRRAAVTFPSEPLTGCYLPLPRICYPSESGN